MFTLRPRAQVVLCKIDIPGNTVVDLKLKPGTQSGTTMRITGKGLLNRGGGQGNVLVKIIGITPTSLEKADLQQIEYINQKYSWLICCRLYNV